MVPGSRRARIYASSIKKNTYKLHLFDRFTFVDLVLGTVTHTVTGGAGWRADPRWGRGVELHPRGTYFAQFDRSGGETVKYAGVPQGWEGGHWPVSHWTGQQLPQIDSTSRNNWCEKKNKQKKPLKIFCFRALIPNHQMLQFSLSALLCLGFLRARCHRRVNYMYAFSPLYSPPPTPTPRLPFLSRRMCAREPVHAVVCLRVCLRTNVCRLGFPLNIPLMSLFIYLFPRLWRPFFGC